MNPDPSSSLEDQVALLTARVFSLEEALRNHGILQLQDRPVAQETLHVTVKIPDEVSQQPTPPPPPPSPTLQSSVDIPSFTTAPAHDERSLESRIGSQWFNRIGILATLIGMAWFLKLAIDNQWIGPVGRVLIGLLAGATLIAWSERFRNHGYAVFSYSLKAVGSGILYLSLWAAFSLFHLLPSTVAFAAMILVTAFNAFIAWRQDAELLALYAIVGGFSTPLLLSTGENHEVALFSYLFLLNAATLLLVALRPWSRLLFGSALGTCFLFIAWYGEYYSSAQFTLTAFFLTLFFAIFALAPFLIQINADADIKKSGWDGLVLVVLPIANGALTFIGFYVMFEGSTFPWAEPWLAVAFSAIYLALSRLPARGKSNDSLQLVSALHLAAAVVFLTLAIPLKAHGRWLTIGWLIEGAALLWVARNMRSMLLRWLSILCLLLGLCALLTVNPAASTAPVFNARFGTYCAAIAVFAFVAFIASPRYRDIPSESSERIIPWHTLALAAALITNALLLLAVSLEIHNFWWSLRWHGDDALSHNFHIYAQFTYSAFFMLYGATLLTAGFAQRSAFLRWQAMVLLAATIGKVFVVDVSELSQGFRVLSFLGLGALLLTVSFIYQRDWLNLRKPSTASNEETP